MIEKLIIKHKKQMKNILGKCKEMFFDGIKECLEDNEDNDDCDIDL
jgi:hypothetical protein